jgi:hypothetical protein
MHFECQNIGASTIGFGTLLFLTVSLPEPGAGNFDFNALEQMQPWIPEKTPKERKNGRPVMDNDLAPGCQGACTNPTTIS